jgi:hypothetical protein
MKGRSLKIALFLVLLPFLILSCVYSPSSSIRDPGTTELPDLRTPPLINTKDVPVTVDLPNLGTAPELSNQVWINTDQPLRLAELRGKVVLLEMWTFG